MNQRTQLTLTRRDSGRTIAEVARELGVNEALLGRWVAEERRRVEAAATHEDVPLTPAERTQRNGVRSQVLEHIDLAIRPSEILGLVGESGSGKSVLALSLLGLLPDTSHPQTDGQVTVSGVDMVRASPADLRRVRADVLGAIFQDPMTSLNPTMRIGRQIGEVTHGDAESVRLLETVGVRDAQLRLRVYPHELSGGLRQRVMAAIAVARRGERGDGESNGPGLIVADEPTTALDVTVQAQLLDLLRELRDEFGCSVLLITHDLGVADQIADRLAVLHHGELVEIGPASDVVRNPRNDYTRSLLASRLSLTMPRDERFRADADDSEPAVSITGLRCTFTVRRGVGWGRGRSREINAVDGVDLDIASGEALAIVGKAVPASRPCCGSSPDSRSRRPVPSPSPAPAGRKWCSRTPARR